MNSKRFLIRLQFLGLRYHGVQKQVNHQTIQGRLEQVLRTAFVEEDVKTRFSSRTDAMVSAEETYCLLMFNNPKSKEVVESALTKLPPDILVLDSRAVEESFTLLKKTKVKTYRYFFSHNQAKPHVFAAPFMTILNEELDIELMKEGAKLFLGTHSFENYCYKPKEGTLFTRTIDSAKVVENTFLTANFFPSQSFVFEVASAGFMRGQVRLMMGSLFRLGKKEISLSELRSSLKTVDPSFVKWMVPSPGLILHKTELD